MSEHEPSITPRIYAGSIDVPEHRQIRDAIDAANVQGTTTWIKNTAGAPVAAIVPLDRVAGLCLRHLQPCYQDSQHHRDGSRCK